MSRIDSHLRPQWGKMSALEMLSHLVASLKMALGQISPEPKNIAWLRTFPMKQIILYWLPFPKGAPTAPELLISDEACPPLAMSKRELERLLDEFSKRELTRPWPDHPAFGRLNGRQWGTLVYRHMDHHLRQFGV
ncbi:MAG TPA: DinB family protein [Thermoanaerobaculia bacterium]|nr:DinB family protein [Thermoanaerobaculia bacterium]